jgi:hypothetical protein
VEIAHGKVSLSVGSTSVQFIVTVDTGTAYSKLASARNLEHYEAVV